MKNSNIIIWEKWKDPFGFENQNDETTIDKIDTDENIDPENDVKIQTQVKKIKCQIITTPFGVIPVDENTASSEIFNFWTGHTNFAVTTNISKIIEDTSGVETLNVFTKYRFRIAIGKAFKDSAVMRKINQRVYSYLTENYVANE